MFYIQKSFTFEASHILPHHQGKCGRLHGHSWKMSIYVTTKDLQESGPSQGMVVDFYDISTLVKPLLEKKLDHWHLNDTTGLQNPTSEELARWVYQQLKPTLPALYMVSINETCTSEARYAPGMLFEGASQLAKIAVIDKLLQENTDSKLGFSDEELEIIRMTDWKPPVKPSKKQGKTHAKPTTHRKTH